MPIRDLQTALAEVGRIRLGLSPAATGSKNPSKLDTFRFTSPAEHLIRGVAELYGGEAKPWQPQNGGPKQWEVITAVNQIPVYAPRQTIDPNYEQWGNGVCTRRCDGYRDDIHDKPCDCNPERRACKPTVRISLILADLVGTGTWRLESHGFYAATELTALTPMLQNASLPLPGILLLDQRERKYFDREEGKPKTKKYPVPVVMFDSITARTLMSGAQAIHNALAGDAGDRPAIESGGSPLTPDLDVTDLVRQIEAAQTREQMEQIRAQMVRRKADTPEMASLWNNKARSLARQAAATPQAQQQPSPPNAGPTVEDPWAEVPGLTAEQELAAAREQMLARIEVAEGREQMMGIRADITRLGIGTPELTKAWNARAAQLVNGQLAAQGRPTGHDKPAPPPIETPADIDEPAIEGEEEPNREEVFMSVLSAAGAKGKSTEDLERAAQEQYATGLDELDGFQMRDLLQVVRGW